MTLVYTLSHIHTHTLSHTHTHTHTHTHIYIYIHIHIASSSYTTQFTSIRKTTPLKFYKHNNTEL
jgi:hypothetical protein